MAEVVVRANVGPAMWRVTKGRSELVILGSVTPTPQDGRWDVRRFAEALQGARVLLFSPGSTPGFAWAEKFGDSQRYLLAQPIGRTLAKELTPAAGARFEAMAATLPVPLEQYGTYRPAPAGMRLLEDAWRVRGLSGSRLDEGVVALAKAAHLRVVKVDEGGGLPLLDAMPSMSKAQHAACVTEEMDQFEWEEAHLGAAFLAWTKGDVAALRIAYQPLSLCLSSIPGGLARRERARAVWIKALGEALEFPGRTVAVADVADLLEPSDVLAALRAEGATVAYPRGERAPPAITTRLAAVESQEAARLDLVDATPEGLRLDAAEPPRSAPATRVAAEVGRRVDLADGDQSCVVETSIGTLLPHTVCHTRAEWREIATRRENERRLFKTEKRSPNKAQPTPVD